MSKGKWDQNRLSEIVSDSTAIAQVLRRLDLDVSGGNYGTFYRKVEEFDIDISHFTGASAPKHDTTRIPLSEILVENSTYSSTHRLKNRLIEENLLQYECEKCGISRWCGEDLSLHLDHINGRSRDHRIENLRLLCPNCHSQTKTYGGKNKKRTPQACKDCGKSIRRRSTRCSDCHSKSRKVPRPLCKGCGKPVSLSAERCKSCAGRKFSAPKIDWPDQKTLKKMVGSSTYREVGRKLGVSDTAIRKRLKTGH